MIKIFILIALFFNFAQAIAEDVKSVNDEKDCGKNATYVKPYYKKDGTYIQGYCRTKPNNTIWDNFSTVGNTNPHTGKEGKTRPQNCANKKYCKIYEI